MPEHMRVTFVAEYVMPFGISSASGIAQRFGDFVLHIFRCLMDEAEEKVEHLEPQVVKEWLAARRKLSKITGRKEDRLYDVAIFSAI